MRFALPIVILLAELATVSAQEMPASRCTATGPVERIPELPEASGLALSRVLPDRLWSHNDSGKGLLIALDTSGSVRGRIFLTGVEIEDWEAIAVGQCSTGSCIYIADIGDNNGDRTRITVHRVPEPKAESSVDVIDTFHATYPDGPHDAETLLVTEAGLFIVTKGDAGPLALYRFPHNLEPGGIYQLERIGETRNVSEPDWVTDGTVSPDGRWVVLRTHSTLRFYPAASFVTGQWQESFRVDLKPLGEPQGEGVAFGAGGIIYLAGEGGGKSQPGSFARFACPA